MIEEVTLRLITGEDKDKKDVSCFDSMIGQSEVRNKLKFFIQSHSSATPFPNMIFSGSQGLGKTYMAKKIANSLGRELIDVNCGAVNSYNDFINNVLINRVLGDKNKVLLLDESHKLSDDITTCLLSLLNLDNYINYISYKKCNIEYDMSKINVIFCTTDLHKMFKPLINRCIETYFNIYTHEELFNMLLFYVKNIDIKCDMDDISYACRGRARDAFLLSSHIIRYCSGKGINKFDNDNWLDMKNILGINKYGLKSEEIKLLKYISESNYISLSNLAVKMGVNINNIESELEIRPREIGLIDNSSRGRFLTDNGKEYLKSI